MKTLASKPKKNDVGKENDEGKKNDKGNKSNLISKVCTK
jgi:hypothetical protein